MYDSGCQWSQQKNICKSQNETGPGVLRSRRSVLACHTLCECSMETTRNSVKVKLGIRVMKFGGKSDQLGSHCNWPRVRISFNIPERETSYC